MRIEQTIFVERESQRKIVLGKGGATIKAIGAESRKEIAEIVGMPVHLFLFVKVRENWGDDPDATARWDWNSPRNSKKVAPMTVPRTSVVRGAALCVADAGCAVGGGQDRTPTPR